MEVLHMCHECLILGRFILWFSARALRGCYMYHTLELPDLNLDAVVFCFFATANVQRMRSKFHSIMSIVVSFLNPVLSSRNRHEYLWLFGITTDLGCCPFVGGHSSCNLLWKANTILKNSPKYTTILCKSVSIAEYYEDKSFIMFFLM